MSTESVRRRLAEATPGPWFVRGFEVARTIQTGYDRSVGAAVSEPDATFIAHARTDLELALAVIEAAKAEHSHVWFLCTCGRSEYSCPVLVALDAWEAAP